MRERILAIIEKNSRIDMKELAVLLGTGEMEILNAMQEMQASFAQWICTRLKRLNQP